MGIKKLINKKSIPGKTCIKCPNGILWSSKITKIKNESLTYIYEAVVKSVRLYVVKTWRITENYKKWTKIEAAFRRYLRISTRDRIKNGTEQDKRESRDHYVPIHKVNNWFGLDTTKDYFRNQEV